MAQSVLLHVYRITIDFNVMPALEQNVRTALSCLIADRKPLIALTIVRWQRGFNRRNERHGSHHIKRTCSVAIHRWLVDSRGPFQPHANNPFISVTVIPHEKVYLPPRIDASSRAGKKRLLTAPTVDAPKKRLHVRNLKPRHTLAWPNPSTCRPASPPCRPTAFSQSRARQAIDQPHYPAAAQHIIFFRDRERASAYGLAGV